MYLTNGEDALVKYDGSSLSRAGLFRWEGATFVRAADTGGIPASATEVGGTLLPGTRVFAVTNGGDERQFVKGQTVVDDNGNSHVVSEIITDTSEPTHEVILSNSSVEAIGSLTPDTTVKYYFRLNMIDANNNIIGSAVSGSSNDYTIQLANGGNVVGIKMAKPPRLDLFDYDRLEFEIYRTKQEGTAFFRVTTILVDYTDTANYIYFEDTTADRLLIEDDPVSTSTFGAELATAIDEPLRAKYITSANNRLVLGNLKDSPRTSVQIFKPKTELSDTELADIEFKFTNLVNEDITYKFYDDTSSVDLNGRSIDSAGLISGASLALTIGQWVYLYKDTNSIGSPEALGWFKATGVSSINYTGDGQSLTDVQMLKGDTTIIPILSSAEASDSDAGYQTGSNQLLIQSKLINAINATQYDLDGFSLSGEGRTDISELGRFNIKALDNKGFELTITSPNLYDVAAVFVNNVKTSSGVKQESETQNYSSRMLVSFPNFPEIFDRPRAIIPQDSLSVVDVNSADGQEITGIIPFFGESTTQDSRKQDIVICFKENSIYAVNISTREITKIDSRGVGCNAPHSIAAVPNGIIFASRSGVYRINRAFDVIWVGRYLDRVWQEDTNLTELNQATGHVYPQEKQYRLSVPVGSDAKNSVVYVYEYGDEAAGRIGGWSVFNNIPSTGWASDGKESYFGSSKGRVYIIRNTRTDSDFRDDDQPIEWEALYRGLDFDAPGKRKIVRAIISHFRVLKSDESTSLDVSIDLKDEFSPTSSFKLQASVDDGLSTIVSSKVKAIRQNLPIQKGIYYQLRYKNNGIDTPVALAGITLFVAGLDHRGIEQAEETTNS
jgi:hypothetical protein